MRRSHAHEDLAGGAVSFPELLCAFRAHVARRDPGCVEPQVRWIFRELGDAVDPHERKRRPVVRDAKRHPRVTSERESFHRVLPRREHDRSVTLDEEPDRRDEWRSVLAHDGDLRGPGTCHQEVPDLLIVERAQETNGTPATYPVACDRPGASVLTRSVVCAGLVVADVFVPPLPSLPEAGELVTTGDFVVETGGCAANAAFALARLGVPAAIVARVGDDHFGAFVEDELSAAGLDVTGIHRAAGLGTSKTVIIPVTGEDRRFIHTFGANAALCAADLAPALATAPDVLYIGGFLVLPALRQDELAAQLQLARQAGTRVVFDVVAPAGRALSLDDVAGVLPQVDYFVPNDDEAAALTGERDPRRQAERLLELGAGTVVVTMGERGLFAAGHDDTIELPAPQVEFVESSGAGDAFAAGLVYGLLQSWPLRRSLEFASVIGGSACTQLGCTAGLVTRAEADALLESYAPCPSPH